MDEGVRGEAGDAGGCGYHSQGPKRMAVELLEGARDQALELLLLRALAAALLRNAKVSLLSKLGRTARITGSSLGGICTDGLRIAKSTASSKSARTLVRSAE